MDGLWIWTWKWNFLRWFESACRGWQIHRSGGNSSPADRSTSMPVSLVVTAISKIAFVKVEGSLIPSVTIQLLGTISNDMTSLRCSQDSLQLVSSLCGENGQFATERYYPRSGFARMWLLSSISNRYRIYEKQKEKEKIISLFFFQFIHSKLTFNNFYILKQLVNSKIYTRNVGAM